MKKRILCLFLSICLLLTPTLAAGVTASPYRSSGLTALPKLSKAQITQLLADAPLGFSGDALTTAPSLTAPYAPGTVSDAALTAALNRLNLMRRLAGLEPVVLDSELTHRAQYGAVLLAVVEELTHFPGQPQDMPDDFYNTGLNATSSSNIYMGTNATLPQAVDAFMDDSDGGNLPILGHRRWILNPSMGKTGFGFSPSNKAFGRYTYNFSTLWAFDRSGSVGDYDFIAWPASGAFPSSLFDKDQAWSVTLNPEKYALPILDNLTVTISRTDPAASWTLRGTTTYQAADQGPYLTLEEGNYGVANCVIFRPQLDAAMYHGVYTVTIGGLQTTAGAETDFSYQVEFFSPGETSDPGQTTPSPQPGQPADPSQPTPPTGTASFTDVSADDWFAGDVAYAAENGLFNGVGNGRFDPNGSMTRVMLMTVLARLDGVDTTPTGQESWYIKGHRWAVTNRISDGLDPHKALTFEELSAMLYNYAKFRYNATAAHNYHLAAMPDGNTVSSWAAEGTNWMVDQGLLQGDENRCLNPQRPATRAQVAALLHRFLDKAAPKN